MVLGPGRQATVPPALRVEALVTAVLTLRGHFYTGTCQPPHLIGPRSVGLAQLRGREAPLEVGDVPLQVDQRLVLLLQLVVDGLAGAAVPNYQVEDALQRTAEVSEVINEKLNMVVFEKLKFLIWRSNKL